MDAKQSAQMLTEQARFSRSWKMILQTILIKFNELGEEVLHFSKTPKGQCSICLHLVNSTQSNQLYVDCMSKQKHLLISSEYTFCYDCDFKAGGERRYNTFIFVEFMFMSYKKSMQHTQSISYHLFKVQM